MEKRLPTSKQGRKPESPEQDPDMRQGAISNNDGRSGPDPHEAGPSHFPQPTKALSSPVEMDDLLVSASQEKVMNFSQEKVEDDSVSSSDDESLSVVCIRSGLQQRREADDYQLSVLLDVLRQYRDVGADTMDQREGGQDNEDTGVSRRQSLVKSGSRGTMLFHTCDITMEHLLVSLEEEWQLAVIPEWMPGRPFDDLEKCPSSHGPVSASNDQSHRHRQETPTREKCPENIQLNLLVSPMNTTPKKRCGSEVGACSSQDLSPFHDADLEQRYKLVDDCLVRTLKVLLERPRSEQDLSLSPKDKIIKQNSMSPGCGKFSNRKEMVDINLLSPTAGILSTSGKQAQIDTNIGVSTRVKARYRSPQPQTQSTKKNIPDIESPIARQQGKPRCLSATLPAGQSMLSSKSHVVENLCAKDITVKQNSKSSGHCQDSEMKEMLNSNRKEMLDVNSRSPTATSEKQTQIDTNIGVSTRSMAKHRSPQPQAQSAEKNIPDIESPSARQQGKPRCLSATLPAGQSMLSSKNHVVENLCAKDITVKQNSKSSGLCQDSEMKEMFNSNRKEMLDVNSRSPTATSEKQTQIDTNIGVSTRSMAKHRSPHTQTHSANKNNSYLDSPSAQRLDNSQCLSVVPPTVPSMLSSKSHGIDNPSPKEKTIKQSSPSSVHCQNSNTKEMIDIMSEGLTADIMSTLGKQTQIANNIRVSTRVKARHRNPQSQPGNKNTIDVGSPSARLQDKSHCPSVALPTDSTMFSKSHLVENLSQTSCEGRSFRSPTQLDSPVKMKRVDGKENNLLTSSSEKGEANERRSNKKHGVSIVVVPSNDSQVLNITSCTLIAGDIIKNKFVKRLLDSKYPVLKVIGEVNEGPAKGSGSLRSSKSDMPNGCGERESFPVTDIRSVQPFTSSQSPGVKIGKEALHEDGNAMLTRKRRLFGMDKNERAPSVPTRSRTTSCRIPTATAASVKASLVTGQSEVTEEGGSGTACTLNDDKCNECGERNSILPKGESDVLLSISDNASDVKMGKETFFENGDEGFSLKERSLCIDKTEHPLSVPACSETESYMPTVTSASVTVPSVVRGQSGVRDDRYSKSTYNEGDSSLLSKSGVLSSTSTNASSVKIGKETCHENGNEKSTRKRKLLYLDKTEHALSAPTRSNAKSCRMLTTSAFVTVPSLVTGQSEVGEKGGLETTGAFKSGKFKSCIEGDSSLLKVKDDVVSSTSSNSSSVNIGKERRLEKGNEELTRKRKLLCLDKTKRTSSLPTHSKTKSAQMPFATSALVTIPSLVTERRDVIQTQEVIVISDVAESQGFIPTVEVEGKDSSEDLLILASQGFVPCLNDNNIIDSKLSQFM